MAMAFDFDKEVIGGRAFQIIGARCKLITGHRTGYELARGAPENLGSGTGAWRRGMADVMGRLGDVGAMAEVAISHPLCDPELETSPARSTPSSNHDDLAGE
jgi:hypothetical protein